MFTGLATEKQHQFVDECFSLWSRSKSSQLTTAIQTALSQVRSSFRPANEYTRVLLQFHFDAKHFLNYWKSIFDRAEKQSIPISNKKLLISKATTPTAADSTEASPINWKQILPSLELFHHDRLAVDHQADLIRPLFSILEKSLAQENDEFEQKTYVQQLAITALLNLYTQLKPGFSSSTFDHFLIDFIVRCLQINVTPMRSTVKSSWNV